MRVLGINDQHNASACLVEDGVVTAAVQEERLARQKNIRCFPHRSIAWVLEECGLQPHEVDGVAVASHHILGQYTTEDLLQGYGNLPTRRHQLRRVLKKTPAMTYVKARRRAERLRSAAAAGLPVDLVRFVEHHTCHAAAAYYGSPWDDEPVLVLTADGQGDGVSATVRIGRQGRLFPPIAVIAREASLGGIYSMVTYLMGMLPLEHEYKLMGMAPYAPEAGARRSYEVFREMLVFPDRDSLEWRTGPGVPESDTCYPYLRQRLERHRFDGIAAGLQRWTEELLCEWVRRAVRRTGLRRVALAGGVFMNVRANQLIGELPEVSELFVFPSCGDESNAMGAAYWYQAWTEARAGRRPRIPGIGPVYWGPAPASEEIAGVVTRLRAKGWHVDQRKDIERDVADLLVRGEIVARVKGRMEFGARALGNRSILADPTRKDAARIINAMVKNRDFWMPFAPALLSDHADDYIVNLKGLAAPYMMLTFDTVRNGDDFPAAVQPYDRTARPQVVTMNHNPDFHQLIQAFYDKTGRAVLLNTSFNLHGHPIVCSAADAVEVMEQSGLQHLALEDFLISKPAA